MAIDSDSDKKVEAAKKDYTILIGSLVLSGAALIILALILICKRTKLRVRLKETPLKRKNTKRKNTKAR